MTDHRDQPPCPPPLAERLRLVRRRRQARFARRALTVGTWTAGGVALLAGLAGVLMSLH